MRSPNASGDVKRGTRYLTAAKDRDRVAGSIRQTDVACVQPRQRQGWYPEKRRRIEPNEGPQRPMVHPSFPQARETRQERWRHGRGRSGREQEERQQLPGEAEDRRVPGLLYRRCGQQLQRGSEEFIKKQQHQQSHEGQALRQTSCPAIAGTVWSVTANATSSMLHTGGTALGDGMPFPETEVQQKSECGMTQARSSQSKERFKRGTETRRSMGNREGRRGEPGISNNAESSCSPCYEARGMAGLSFSGTENDGNRSYIKRGGEKDCDSNRVIPGSNWWEIRAGCNEEDGMVRQVQSCCGRQPAIAHDIRGAMFADKGGGERRRRDSSASSRNCNLGKERLTAESLPSRNNSSSLSEPEWLPVGSLAQKTSAAAAHPPSESAPAVTALMGRKVMEEQRCAGTKWAAENAKAEGPVAVPMAPPAPFSRATAAADLIVAATSCETSTKELCHSSGNEALQRIAVADGASTREKRALQTAPEGVGEGTCDPEEVTHFLKPPAARAADNQRSQHLCAATQPPADPKVHLDTACRRSTIRAQMCISSCTAAMAHTETISETWNAESKVSGRIPTATAVRLCHCGCCSYCSRHAGEDIEATKAERLNTGESATSADPCADRMKGTQFKDGPRTGSAAVEDATEAGHKKAKVMATEEELRAHLRRVEALNEVLLTNISSLYKTAKAELERKDATIAEKDGQIADLRLKLQETMRGGPHQQHRTVSNSFEIRQKHQQHTEQRRQKPKTSEKQLYTCEHHQPVHKWPQLQQQRYSGEQHQSEKQFQQLPESTPDGRHRRPFIESSSEPWCRYTS